LKFLHLSSVFPPAYGYGGVPAAACGLAAALGRLGHENLVLTTDADGSKRLPVICDQIIDHDDFKLVYARRLGCNPYFFSPSLARHIRSLAPGFDIALVRGNWGYINYIARRILTEIKVPYVLFPEGIFDPWAIRHKHIRKWFYWQIVEKYNYRQAAGIIALTKSEYAQVKSYAPGALVEVIPNGIDLACFYPAPGITEICKRFPPLADKPFFLFLSRLHIKKGLDIFLPAFARFISSFDQTADTPVLVIAGAGEAGYEAELREQVASLGIRKHVVFTGMVSGLDKLALLHHCQFLVLPSRSEGLPVAVLEAMACGKPVIITPPSNLPEVEKAGAGLVAELTPAALSQALLTLWAKRDRNLMGEKALNLIQNKFTWDAAAQQTMAFCKQILHSRGQ